MLEACAVAVAGGEPLASPPPFAPSVSSAPQKVTAGPKFSGDDLSRRCSLCFLS